MIKDALILPQQIEHYFYNEVLECVLERQERKTHETLPPLRLYCRSDGGDSRSALGIVSAIRMDGDVHGIMVGDSLSSAATIWAACQQRSVCSIARMGIHPVAWDGVEGIFDSRRLKATAEDFAYTDHQQCEIYANASNKPVAWWLDLYQNTARYHWFTAQELIALNMAQAYGTE